MMGNSGNQGAAIAAARAAGIAIPLDLARKTFAVTRKLAAQAQRAVGLNP
jgi:hypothetical protein